VTDKMPLSREALLQLPGLELIGVPHAGGNHLDLETCCERGNRRNDVRGVLDHLRPEHAFALLMALRRNLVFCWRDVLAGYWSRSPAFYVQAHPVPDLYG
jgi:glycerate dehydrogenase